MSHLRNRIIRQAGANRSAMGGWHPYGTGDTPLIMPLALVQYSGNGARVEQLVPLVASNGALIPASAPGAYGHVRIAGNGRY